MHTNNFKHIYKSLGDIQFKILFLIIFSIFYGFSVQKCHLSVFIGHMTLRW